MPRILVITQGSMQTASTWYRLGQYLPFFQQAGYEILWSCHDQDMPKDVVAIINQKCLTYQATHRGKLPVFFDFDDAIWTRPKKPYKLLTKWRTQWRFQKQCHQATQIFAPNHYLLQHAGRGLHVPMALDPHVWYPKNTGRGKTIKIGWSGAPHNLHYLESIQDQIKPWIEQGAELHVFSGQKPHLTMPYHHTRFVKGEEANFIRHIDIGLLPLDQDAYTLGKSPIKALQYMSCGVPVIASPMGGGTREILADAGCFAHHGFTQGIEHVLDAYQAFVDAGLKIASHHQTPKIFPIMLGNIEQHL